MSQHDTLTLEQALRGLLATGGVIAEASDEDLQAAIDDPHAEEIIKTQAAAILKARAALSATQPVRDDGWLQERGLLHRLTDDRRPHNRDEIRVMMADGSRSDEACSRRAGELLDRIRATRQPRPRLT